MLCDGCMCIAMAGTTARKRCWLQLQHTRQMVPTLLPAAAFRPLYLRLPTTGLEEARFPSASPAAVREEGKETEREDRGRARTGKAASAPQRAEAHVFARNKQIIKQGDGNPP
jgi:hypothetical protein